MGELISFRFVIEAIGLAGLVAFSYASTNLDNFVIFSAYSARPGYRAMFGGLAYVSACLIVILVSLVVARAADTLIANKLRYLGVIPLGIGLYHLCGLVFQRARHEDAAPAIKESNFLGWPFYLTVGLALLANSSDSIVVLTPIFADLRPPLIPVCAGAAIAMAVVISSIAAFIGTQPLLRARIEKVAHWAMPLVLIGIGVMILTREPEDAFVAVDGLANSMIAFAPALGAESCSAPGA